MSISKGRITYRLLRSVLFTIILTVVGIYVILYVGLSIPWIQNGIRDFAVSQLSDFLGTEASIGKVGIEPFNSVVLEDVDIPDPDGGKCIHIDKVAAGIDLTDLIIHRHITINYGEVIGLDAAIRQRTPDSPMNIQFLIDAFKPKDPDKPPTKFDLTLQAIVIRRSHVTFDKEWMPRKPKGQIDFNHLDIRNLRSDLTLPLLSNEHFKIDLRRLAFEEASGLTVQALALKADITPEHLALTDISLQLPGTRLKLSDISLPTDGIGKVAETLKKQEMAVSITGSKVNPKDFAALWAPLGNLDRQFTLSTKARGNMSSVTLDSFTLTDGRGDFDLALKGALTIPDKERKLAVNVDAIGLDADLKAFRSFTDATPAAGILAQVIDNLGYVRLAGKGEYADDSAAFEGNIESTRGNLVLDALYARTHGNRNRITASVSTESFDASGLIKNLGLGKISASIDADLDLGPNLKFSFPTLPDINGTLYAEIPSVEFNLLTLSNIIVDFKKQGEQTDFNLSVADDDLSIYSDAKIENGNIDANLSLSDFRPAVFGISGLEADASITGNVNTNLSGSTLDDITGHIHLNDFSFKHKGKTYQLDYLDITSTTDGSERNLKIRSDLADATISGDYRLTAIPETIKSIVARVAPSWVPFEPTTADSDLNADIDLTLKSKGRLQEYVKLPFKLLEDLNVRCHVEGADGGLLTLTSDIPWLQQGKDKLVTDTRIGINMNGADRTGAINLTSNLPVKKGRMTIDLAVDCNDDKMLSSVGWNFNKPGYHGKIDLEAMATKQQNPVNGKFMPHYHVDVKKSNFMVNDTVWHVNDATIDYSDKRLAVKNIEVSHNEQMALIDGVASAMPNDTVSIRLNEIDLDYLFETLAINYVNFGGVATGLVKAANVFSGHPVAFTDNLFVKGLKYNGAVLGDAILTSRWDNDQKEVTIGADIAENGRRTAMVNGGIWVTRDSLSFDINTDGANAKFLEPFFEAFASDVRGKASGWVKLYGTFADVNLIGRAYADNVSLRVNYTNVEYNGSDSVIMTPGRIEVPGFRVYDKAGNSGVFSGVVTHNYFHEPRFDFIIRDCNDLLLFDTNSRMNPIWYGTIYGTGGGSIKGWPGVVGITAEVTSSPKSSFTLVLSDSEEAVEYKFLTFSDKRKEATRMAEKDTIPDFVKAFNKKVAMEQQAAESVVALDLRGNILPNTKVNIIMDPVGGDKITCMGRGSIQAGYNSASEAFTMNGKYTIDEGSYNFTLQDLILKDFTIKPGSSIMFDGDPFNAELDIDAVYKVNTNLADLDKSFSTDRDLNRTNVQVDAVLKVDGALTHPDISFDIELPTLKQDAARKVKSIISTDDMMNRQIIYLLALNRFYTPEYMGSGNSGGEWASVASSTLSSQISNIMDNISDKWTLAPSFHSDKGDFSDFEFDVALSSRLLNNRLLFNGNFGYRDKTTSTTTFIGDFDIEYLLNSSGNLRFKAYNHFNDQNYYLRSALTTQGLGIVYKHDFNNILNLFRWRKRRQTLPTDSITKK